MILTLDQLKQIIRRSATGPSRGPCSSIVFEASGGSGPAGAEYVAAVSTDGHRVHFHELDTAATWENFRAVVPAWALEAAAAAADVALREGAVELVPPEGPEPGWLERGGETSRGATLRVHYGSQVSAEIRAIPQTKPAPARSVIPAGPAAVVARVNVSKALRALPGKGEAVQLRQVGASLWLDVPPVGNGVDSKEFGDIEGCPAYGPFTTEFSRAYLRDALRVAKASGDLDVRLELRPPSKFRNIETPAPLVILNNAGDRVRAVVSPRRIS